MSRLLLIIYPAGPFSSDGGGELCFHHIFVIVFGIEAWWGEELGDTTVQ